MAIIVGYIFKLDWLGLRCLTDGLDLGVVGVESDCLLLLLGRIFLLRVGQVGILTGLDGFENAGGVPLCVFDLVLRARLSLAPDVCELEEGRGSFESDGGLSEK